MERRRNRVIWDLPLLFLTALVLMRLVWTLYFLLLDVRSMALFSAAGGAVHLALLLLRKRAELPCLVLGQMEVCCFGVLGTCLTGWRSGFYLGPLAMLAGVLFLCGIRRKRLTAMQMPGVISLAALLAVNRFLPVHFNGVDAARDALYFPTFAINLTLAAGITAVSAVLFCSQLNLSERRLEGINRRLEYMATHDALTGLQNRHSMNELLTLCKAQAERSGVLFSIAMGDVDDFKHFNDTYGHGCGDRVLTTLAETIRGATREGDFVCRWGGEEMLILFSATRASAAKHVLARIQEKIHDMGDCGTDIPENMVTMTFGLCEYQVGWSVEQMIQKADERLYQGKARGKDCIVD